MKIRAIGLLAALAAMFLLTVAAPAQTKGKAHKLHGKIEAVKTADKKVTVNHDKIDNYMGAMTMDYKVADPAILKKLKPGDEITATLYEDDFTLYNIQLVRIDDRVHPPR